MRPFLLLGALLSAGASAQEPAVQVSTSSAPPIFGVYTERKNVFDPLVPGEDWWLFRFANKLHILTRREVVERELLLHPGDPWNPVKAIEMERNLRGMPFIRRAEVLPVASASKPGALDLQVLTQDSWTLSPQISAGTEGGDNYFIYGIQEKNLLGYGKTVSFFHSQIGPDTRNEARYVDKRLFKTWLELTSLYADTPRGDEVGVLLQRPFYSLTTAVAGNAAWARIIQEDVIYQDAEEFSKFIQNHHTASPNIGFRLNKNPDFVHRAHLGTNYTRNRFDPTVDTVAGTLPDNRTLSGPIAGYSWIQARYIKEEDIDNMKRAEDFNLGNEFFVAGGPMLRSWGSDRDRWIYSVLNQQGLKLGQGRFMLGQVGTQGRLAGDTLENALFYANLNLFWKTRWPIQQTFVSHLEINTTRNLDKENQIVLGGNTGLRGYKNNSFTGGRSVLLNFEDRFFHDRQFFHLVYVGAVAFFDTGAVVPTSAPITKRDFKSDVGVGLRLSPSRSTSGGVLRMDVAYALNDGPGSSRWVVSIRGSQAFSIFNSTNRRILRPPSAALADESAGTRLRRQ